MILFLCGDVMIGRGIDQILPFPSDPIIHEFYLKSALDYVKLAEMSHGPIQRPVDFCYIWGAVLREFERYSPLFKIINLETSVTQSEDWKDQGINYRMSPKNIPVLLSAGIDCCVLANNHVLDWGETGLVETIQSLNQAGIRTAGAGLSLKQAQTPAILGENQKNRVLVFAFGTSSSGVPLSWSVSSTHMGVNYLANTMSKSVSEIQAQIESVKRPGDRVIVSIHWGQNWGYEISEGHRIFAHQLIDHAGVDLIHGHSSHHVQGLEVYQGKLILYGCGDLINDYEGVSGYESFRPNLRLLYFPNLNEKTGRLEELTLIVMQTKKFQLVQAPDEDVTWIKNALEREGRKLKATLIDVDKKFLEFPEFQKVNGILKWILKKPMQRQE